MEKVAEVTIDVPFKSAGNVIRQQEVCFEVFREGKQFNLKPLLSEAERRLANLPETLGFKVLDGRPFSDKGDKDSNLHVIQDVVHRL